MNSIYHDNLDQYAIENDLINDRVRKLTEAMKNDGDLEYARTLTELARAKRKFLR